MDYRLIEKLIKRKRTLERNFYMSEGVYYVRDSDVPTCIIVILSIQLGLHGNIYVSWLLRLMTDLNI